MPKYKITTNGSYFHGKGKVTSFNVLATTILATVLNYDVESETEEVDRALTISRNYSKRLQNPLGQFNKIPVLPNVKEPDKQGKS